MRRALLSCFIALVPGLCPAQPLLAEDATPTNKPIRTADRPEQIVEVAKAASFCVLSAGKQGVDTSRFDDDSNWEPLAEGGGYTHRTIPISVDLPPDGDGIARICVVRSKLASQFDQELLDAALRLVLRHRPLEHSSADEIVWVFDTRTGTRGLQFFLDNKSDNPDVRLIGAAF